MRTLAFATMLLAGAATAQNLVPNGSFEDYYDCPQWLGWMQVQSWTSPHNQSADYFNACEGTPNYGVPLNYFGYQPAAHGQAYMGIANYRTGTVQYRELIQTALQEPLQIGVPVCLSFKIAVGGFGSHPSGLNSAIYTCKGVGMQFFEQLPTSWPAYFFPNSASLYLNEVPTDTAIWYFISGVYVPDSAYTHLVIGNFFSDSLNQVTLLDSVGFGNWPTAYTFVDDVRVSFNLDYCDQVSQVAEPGMRPLLVFPNPFNDRVEILLHGTLREQANLEVLDGLGRVVYSSRQTNANRVMIEFPSLPSGYYLLRAGDARGVLYTVPVVHVSP